MDNCEWKLERKINLLPKMASVLPTVADEIVKETADAAVQVIEQLAPKRTMRLSRSGRSKRIGNASYVVSVGNIVVDGVLVDYQWWVEHGTEFQEAQPYFHPAMEDARKTLKILMRGLKRRLIDAAR